MCSFQKGHLNKRANVWTPWTPPGSATGLSITLTATDQKPQNSLKRSYCLPSHRLNVNVMLSIITFLMIFAVFDPSPLALWIKCSCKYLHFLFYCQVCVMCYCVITEYIYAVYRFSVLRLSAIQDCRKLKH